MNEIIGDVAHRSSKGELEVWAGQIRVHGTENVVTWHGKFTRDRSLILFARSDMKKTKARLEWRRSYGKEGIEGAGLLP